MISRTNIRNKKNKCFVTSYSLFSRKTFCGLLSEESSQISCLALWISLLLLAFLPPLQISFSLASGPTTTTVTETLLSPAWLYTETARQERKGEERRGRALVQSQKPFPFLFTFMSIQVDNEI